MRSHSSISPVPRAPISCSGSRDAPFQCEWRPTSWRCYPAERNRRCLDLTNMGRLLDGAGLFACSLCMLLVRHRLPNCSDTHYEGRTAPFLHIPRGGARSVVQELVI